MLNPNYLELVKAQLTQFATQSDFETVLTTAFGTKIDRTKIFQLRQQWLKGDFSLIPPIEVLTNGELGHANGGYAGSEDKIFVSSDFIAQNQNNSKAITGLLLEEFGHKIDRFFNGDVDSAGDEGDIFSRLVSGQILSAQTLAGLKAEDDTAVIIVDGKLVSIEQQWLPGTTGPDTLEGTDTTDFIFGDAGDDTLKGKAGDDYLAGEYGDDKLYGDAGDDYLYGNEGEDYLDGGIGEDFLSGGDSIDDLYGGIGNDVLYGGAGEDYLDGGAGSDTIYAGAEDDRIRGVGKDIIDGEEGEDFLLINNSGDTANTTIKYTYINNGNIAGGASDGTTFKSIESVSLWTGSGNDKIDITEISNFVSNLFNSDNYVNAGGGDDTIDGASGYSRNSLHGGTGNDKITSHGSGTNSLYGGAGNDEIVVGSGDDTVDGGDGNDSITALYSGVKRLSGGAGNDYISADYSQDYMYVAVRNDTIDGGDGIDTFRINNNSIFQDAVDTQINYTNANNGKITGGANNGTTFKNIESVNFTTSSGNDEIYVYAATGDSYINAGAGNNDIWTGYGNDTVYTHDGNSKIRTGEGNDTIQTIRGNNTIYAGGGNDTINTGGSNDIIYAGAGNDTIRSGIAIGRITMDGGDGKDKASLDAGFSGNTTIENTSATSGKVTGGSLDGTTFKNIESLSIITHFGKDFINLSLSTGDNVVSTGVMDDTIITGSGNDVIHAGTGNDTIIAGKGSDIIDGDAGKDSLYINNYNDPIGANTTILYTTTLNGTVAGGSSNGTTFKNIEKIQAQTGSGNDKIDISAATGDSSITANAGNDTLIGGVGNDNLTGGTGNDTMTGGAGNDIYHVDSASDIIIENANGGYDTVYSSAVNYTLALNVEKLVLEGSANGTGNSGDNIISTLNPLLNAPNNFIINYNNVIDGGAGNDTLIGGNGNDTLIGGIGNDTYSINADFDLGTDTINETLTGGIDTIDFSTTGNHKINIDLNKTTTQLVALHTQNAIPGRVELVIPVVSIENVTGGTLDDTITGNNLNNILNGNIGNDILNGNTGNDTLNGSIGNDTLNGGAGNDTLNGGLSADLDRFLFNGGTAITGAVTVSSLLGKDKISDFTQGKDKIVLSKGTFTKITAAAGAAIGINFDSVATDALAGSSSAAIVYNTTTDTLIYNHNGAADGFGTNGGVFASVSGNLNIAATDFSIVA